MKQVKPPIALGLAGLVVAVAGGEDLSAAQFASRCDTQGTTTECSEPAPEPKHIEEDARYEASQPAQTIASTGDVTKQLGSLTAAFTLGTMTATVSASSNP